ncbi:MAG: ABC transporter ATP-binding protein [Acutalibacteraceae bacterium]
MITISNVTKKFGKKTALNNLSCNINKGSVFGLVGSNGSGKSTLLRVLAGVFDTEGGTVKYDGQPVFENPQVKQKIFYVSDYPYFFNDSTVENTARLYRNIYDRWSEERYNRLCGMFPINKKARIINMSKGMQRQAALILALSCSPQYILLDEIFDGLDPVVRQLLKKLLIYDVSASEATVIIASHNLRELEDLCDHVGLLHEGGILLEKELDDMKLGIHKVQAAFNKSLEPGVLDGLDIVSINNRGLLYNMVIKGDKEEIMNSLKQLNPVFVEALPLTLEEVFINEMEVAGYDINHIV